MGAIYYGESRRRVVVDDRPLFHLKLVILARFRRGEGCALTWEKSAMEGHGRSTIWLHPAVALEFEFDGSKQATVNRLWLEQLTNAANSSNGLTITREPTARA